MINLFLQGDNPDYPAFYGHPRRGKGRHSDRDTRSGGGGGVGGKGRHSDRDTGSGGGGGGGSDLGEKCTTRAEARFWSGNVEFSFFEPKNGSDVRLISGIPIKRVPNLRAAESFVSTKGYAKVPKGLEKEYTRHWSVSECPPNKLRYLF